MQKIVFILLLIISSFGYSQTNSLVTEYYLANNFTPLSGITPGSNNTLFMDCDQILARYNVSISGATTTGHRLPSQNQITDALEHATAEMAFTLYSNPSPGLYNYTGTVSIHTTDALTGSIEFALDFLDWSVPEGQSEYRSAYLDVDGYDLEITGTGSMGSFSESYNASTTTTFDVNLVLTFDNWDYPRPTCTFRVRLLGGTNIDPLVANSTTTNETTFVTSLSGITTTFINVAETTGGRTESGEMIYYSLTRASGPTYSAANGYKSAITLETFDTGTSASTKEFIEALWLYNTIYYNYLNNSYSDGSTNYVTMDFITNTSYYTRYYLRNESGSTATFAYNQTAYKYCELNSAINYSESISSLIPGGHILSIESFTGNGDYVPSILVIPGYPSLSYTDTFSYKYVFHCPTGGRVSLYYSGTNHFFYDGQETSNVATYYPTDNIRYSSISKDIETLGGNAIVRGSALVYFWKTDQYIEIVLTAGNAATNANYPYRIGYYGAY